MANLAQIIAIEADAKKHSAEAAAIMASILGKSTLLKGLYKTYEPKDAEGEKLPAEKTEVQFRVDDLVARLTEALTRTWDLTATKDLANCSARADVVIDGIKILSDVPGVTLLFLEKQLALLEQQMKATPTLDPSQQWKLDGNDGLYKTEAVKSIKTAKVESSLVLIQPTVEHPGQAVKITKDVTVGTWTKTETSGAWTMARLDQVISRIRRLHTAVKLAREQANTISVVDRKVGDDVLGYIFNPNH